MIRFLGNYKELEKSSYIFSDFSHFMTWVHNAINNNQNLPESTFSDDSLGGTVCKDDTQISFKAVYLKYTEAKETYFVFTFLFKKSCYGKVPFNVLAMAKYAAGTYPEATLEMISYFHHVQNCLRGFPTSVVY